MRVRIVTTVTVLLVVSLVCFGGHAQGSQLSPKYGGELRIAMVTPLKTWDPTMLNHPSERYSVDLIYSNLTQAREIEGGKIETFPELAESWEPHEAGRIWIFHLRKGVKWHNGKELEAEDVAWSLNRAIRKKARSRKLLGPIDHVEAVDNHTVKVVLKDPCVEEPRILSIPSASILPRWNEKNMESNPIGTGPFRLQERRPGEYIKFIKFKDYFEEGLPYLDNVQIYILRDPNTRLAGLIAGDFDVAINAHPSWYPLVKGRPIKIVRIPACTFNSVAMRNDMKPFNDVRVRQAIAYCIDREELAKAVMQEHGLPGNDYSIPPTSEWYNPNIPFRKQNYEKAKRLLDEAGYPEGLNLDLYTTSDRPGGLETSIVIQRMVKPVNIKVNVINIETPRVWVEAWNIKPFFTEFEWLRGPFYIRFVSKLTSGADRNTSRYNNPEFDELLKRINAELDKGKRKELVWKAAEFLHRDVPLLIPIFMPDFVGVREGVHFKGCAKFLSRSNEIYKSWKE